MCCRYGFVASGLKTWGLPTQIAGFKDNYNATPGSFLPVLTAGAPFNVDLMKWGLVPHWSKTATVKFSTVNARAETIDSSPTFRDSFLHRRCLIPCFGFYEWRQNVDKSKTPFLITLKPQPFFTMAGIWDYWLDAEQKEFKSYAIITTAANEVMVPIHNRMPVMFTKRDEAEWMNPDAPAKTLHDLLKPIDSDIIESQEIDSTINNPKNNTKSLIHILG